MLGASIGASVGPCITWDSIVLGVLKSVYITFVILQSCSPFFALLVQLHQKLRRTDRTAIASFGHVHFRDSIRVMGRLLCEWRTLLLLPVMFSPELFFPFQANINAYTFNLRTRNLNILLNTLFQFPVTAMHTITVNCAWITGAYIAQAIWLNSWNFNWKIPGPEIDCTDKADRGAMMVYLSYAAQYGMFQSLVLYVLGSFTYDPVKAAACGVLYTGETNYGKEEDVIMPVRILRRWALGTTLSCRNNGVIRIAYIGTDTANLNNLVRPHETRIHDTHRPQYLHYPIPSFHPPLPWKPTSDLLSGHYVTPGAITDLTSFPVREVCDSSVETYFTEIHPSIPIIDEADFLRSYADPKTPPLLLLFHAALLAAARVSDRPMLVWSRATATATLYRRARALFNLRYENDRLLLVQSSMLVARHTENPDTVGCNSYC
ncbi:hypothetical protein Z517_00005 [Fonsecaea pedrosoi CBS 271.37]|uniref:Xylanolytic transcriptional activator regulatory domain-containing protein n=1 Tax=Fonsecaea pedrosoi CBS 271.37 TaxID=1442368 RepID=A0A0D2FDA9_9EURO|nr:uncharacterized protein Z517_00005 [Fonsecaea pedrosoi CBS 271.37]KIW84617.1 hypothetical protein Z517_00005 [Fonsecaea pedrosoi CBS 271.37]